MQQMNSKAAKGAKIGIGVYLLLSALKLSASFLYQSSALRADGLNNLTDIISSVVIFVGLHIAKRPADNDHHYGHSKFEPLASFTTSLIMFTIGFEVIKTGVERFMYQRFETPNMQAAIVSIISAIILAIAYRYVAQLAASTKSLGLKASAHDMRNDCLISIATSIAIVATSLGLTQLDTLMSLVVGSLIIKTAYNIFKESTFTLSDGFDADALENYRKSVLKHPQVKRVTNLKGRLCGSQIYVDITVEIDGNLSVIKSHEITEEIERILGYNYSVREVDVHVEPFFEKEKENALCHQSL